MDWLLIRGWGRESRHWEEFPAQLQRATGAGRVQTLDLAGTGTQCAAESQRSISAMVQDLRMRWLSTAGSKADPVSILGISLGGMVAFEWAKLFPQDFKRVVIINSSASNLVSPWQRLNFSQLGRILKILVTNDATKREAEVLRMSTSSLPESIILEIAQRWAGFAEECPVSRINVLKQLAAATRFRLDSRLSIPTLVLNSKGDQLVNSECSTRIAEFLGAKLETHPSAGHDLPLDAPDWTVTRIREWLTA